MNYKYFDNASTTQVDKDVLTCFIEKNDMFYNPSALNKNSVLLKNEIENCRAEFLHYLNGKPKSKFIFTGSASESNNAVLRSCIRRKDKHYIVSAGEHSSIYNTVKALINEGYNIDFAPLNQNGSVNTEALYSLVNDKTAFISIIHVSNETGAINDIKEITHQIKSINPNILIHSDGVQALHKIDINLTDLGVDFYTISSHKINGIKGIAGLYIGANVTYTPFIYGGGQEYGLRGGTENYPAIASFLTALKLPNYDYKLLKQLKEELISSLDFEYQSISDNDCVPNIISIAIKNIRGESILHLLDDEGYIIGTGSACNSKDKTNRVLDAIGVDKKLSMGNIRISFDDKCLIEDMRSFATTLNDCVKYYIGRTKK